MTEIRQPFGPGVGDQPGIGKPEGWTPGGTEPASAPVAPAAPVIDVDTKGGPGALKPQAPAGVGSSEWWETQRIEPYRSDRIMAEDALGSVGALPTSEWVYQRADSRNLTAQDPRFPLPIEQLGPIDIVARGEGGGGARLGALNVDFLAPENTIDEIGQQLGQEGWGDRLEQFMRSYEMDPMSFEFPSRLMDYGVAFPIAVLGMPFGEDNVFNDVLEKIGGNRGTDQWYAFQKTQAYWDWLVSSGPGQSLASPEQIRNMASQMATRNSSGAAAVLSQRALEEQMTLDQMKSDELALSTGNPRYDWIAKTGLVNTWPGTDYHMPDAYPVEREAWARGVIEKMWAYDPDLPHDKEMAYEWVLRGTYSQSKYVPGEGFVGGKEDAPESGVDWRPYGDAKDLANSLAAMSATVLPVIGTQIAEFIDPTDAFREAFWRAVDPEMRSKKSGDIVGSTMMADMGTLIAGGVILAPWVMGGAVASASLPARAAYQGWTIGRNITKASLIWGVTNTSAHFALQFASPTYAATTGQMVNAARPMSESPFSGVFNAAGIITTGSLGVIPTLQVAKHGVQKVARASSLGGKVNWTGSWEPGIVQDFFGGGASRTTRMFDNIGMDPTVQELSEMETISSYLANHTMEGQTRQIFDALNGAEMGSRMDKISARAWLRYAEQHIKELDPQLAAEKGWVILMKPQEPGLWTKLFDDPAMRNYKDRLKAHRSLNNDISQKAVRDYAGYHGGTKEAVIGSTVKRLERMQTNFPNVLSQDVDLLSEVTAVGGRLGDDVEELQKAANRAHAIEFHLENTEMTLAAVGSEEAQRIHLIRQRSLLQSDITDELLVALRSNDAAAEAAKADLKANKDEVAKRLAGGDLTPAELADYLEETKPLYAIKRVLPDANSPTAADPLNTYQRRLIEDGEWDIGYIPYMDETIPGIGDSVMPVLPDGSMNVGIKGEVQAWTEPPDGWRRIVPGEEFRATRKFAPTPSDGVYVKELTPGEVPAPVTSPGAFVDPNTSVRIGFQPEVVTSDAVLVGYIKTGDSNTYFDSKGYLLYEPPNSNLIPVVDEFGDEIILHGGWGDATAWPVLRDENGMEWVFKAFRGSGGVEGLVDLAPGAVASEVRIGRLYSMLGLEGAAARPYTYTTPGGKRLTGTLQPYFDDISPIAGSTHAGTFLDEQTVVDAWSGLSQNQREDVMGHWMLDWLFDQHDTNPGSLFIRGSDGKVIGVDKGQALKPANFKTGADWVPGLDYKPNSVAGGGVGQDTFTDFLEVLRGEGVAIDRGLIEDTLQRLESIPDDVFDQQMLRIGMAREADPQLLKSGWNISADDFAQEMASRRRHMRAHMDDVFLDELGGANIPHHTTKIKMFKTGRPLTYQPSFGGPIFRNQNVDLSLLQDQAKQASFIEPAPGDIKRAGVVIVEEDGSIWMAEPTGHFDGYRSQSIKGWMDDGETLRDAAVREAYEETGFGVGLEAHLIDIDGIRYYIGHRLSGGPKNVEIKKFSGTGEPKPEVSQLINAQPQDHMSLIRAGAKQSGIDRDTALIEAFLQHKSGGTLRSQVDDAMAGQIGNTGTEAAALPGVSPQTARRYVSYQRLGTGEFIRAPWVDQALSAPGPKALGKRTYLGAKLDAAFRGFRTWRIAETQRANLFRRMARDYRGIDSQQIEVFTKELERIAEERHIPVQLVGNANAHVLQTAPLIGGGIRKETVEAAEKVFGKNLIDNITGEVIPTAHIPWRDIIAKSYRQAFKHNLSAGFTSYIYSLPGGWMPSLVGQGLWPMIKFTLSPIFKISEYAESGGFNLGRGIRAMPDDIAALYEPHMGFSRSMIAGEQGLSPYLSGMGAPGRIGDHINAAGKGAAFSELGLEARTAANIRSNRLTTWDDGLAVQPFVPNVSQDGVSTYLHGPSTTSSATMWPDSLPDYTPQAMLPRRLGPDGKTLVNYSPAEWDAARLADQQRLPMSWDRYLQTDADMEQALYGLAVLRELGYERIDRLIDSMPIFHNPGRDWLSKIDFSNPEFLHGPRGTRMDSGALHAEATREGTLDWAGSIGNMHDAAGIQQLTLQAGQAKYSILGMPDTLSRGNSTIVFNHDVIKRSLITDTDRINTGFNYGDSAMTAQGLLSNTRHQLLRNISEMRPGEKLDDVLKSGAYNNELATFDAPSWAEVDAIVFDSKAAMEDFVRQVDAAPQEVKDALAHIRLEEVKRSNGRASWGQTANDMMWEQSGLAELRDVTPILPRDESLISLIRPENVPPAQGEAMMTALGNRARIAGWEINQPPQTGYGRPSIMDDLSKQIEEIQSSIDQSQAFSVRESLKYGRAGDDQANLFERQAEKTQAESLWRRLEEWSKSKTDKPTFTNVSDARRGELAILRSTDESVSNIDAYAETMRAWERGELETQDFIDYIVQTDELVMTPGQRSALAKATQDHLRMEEFIDAYRVVKHGDTGMIPAGAKIDGWEIFGAKGTVTNSATGERVAFTSDPMELGAVGHYEQRRQYVDAVAVQRAMGDRLPPVSEMSVTTTVFPSTAEFRGNFITAEFVDRIHKRAIEARNGVDPGSPIVDIYARGTREGIMDGPRSGDVEIVMVVRSADNETLGLTLKEVEDIWMETGLPKNHVGPHGSLGQIGWDDTTQEVLIGGDMDLLRNTLPDGSVQIDGGGIRGAHVVFADSFESGGQAYKSLVGYSDGYFDPQMLRQSAPDAGGWVTREYRAVDNAWSWSYKKERNTIHADLSQQGVRRKDAAEDSRFRDIFAFAKGEGKDRSWRVEVSASSDTTENALKRAWYLGEIPDNVVLVKGTPGAADEVMDAAYFQHKWGAKEDIKNLHAPRGPEDVPGTAEYVQRSVNDEIAYRLGVDPADIAAGDINAVLRNLPEHLTKEQSTLVDFLKHIMDPIPFKERMMNRQIMQEVNGIFVGVMKDSKDPAYGYFKKLGVPDEDITQFLLQDRDLVDKWLTTGRQSDFDAIIAHTEKYTKKPVGKAERQLLDDLYSSSDYQTMQQMWRMSLRAAQDEAFGVHFFNPYRSWFERSLNHPVFGIYPLSWSLKAAREWARFLFDNSLLAGGKMRIGMTPAVLINEYNHKLDQAVAMNGGSVSELLSINGALGNMMMTAGLIMPGDWSSVPFPFSRTIRDIIRGNVDTNSMIEDNMVGGFIRDARLLQGSLQEGRDLLKPYVPEGTPVFYNEPKTKPARVGPTTRGSDINFVP